MPGSSSIDLRERVLAAYEAGEGSQGEIARRFRVGGRANGRGLAEGSAGGGPPRAQAARGRPAACRRAGRGAGRDRRRAERRDPGRVRRPAGRAHGRTAQPFGPVPGAQGARAGPEEKTLWAVEQERAEVAEARTTWRAELAGIDPKRLVFIDETGIDTRMTRAHGRAARGRRATGGVPCGRWERLTVVGALALDGMIAAMSIAAATSTAVFLAFTEQVLVPALRERPDAIVVMDNLAVHKAQVVRDGLDRAGLGHRYLPPYSPDLNPIEQAWSKLKARLRAEGARSREALEHALGPALAAITARDARGWFRLCGCGPAN
jgi:transposase